MSREFLLEIGTEEIPAWMIPGALASLRELLQAQFQAAGLLDGASLETFSTPRRLVAYCANLKEREPDTEKQVVGPPKSVAYDAEGQPTRAAESFAAKQGVTVRELKVVSTPKGEYVAAIQRKRGRPASQVLSEVLPVVIPAISFPKTMYWTLADGRRSPRWIRPIRWLVVLLGGKVVPVRVGDVKASNQTCGHRFLGRDALTVNNFAAFERKLGANGVLLRAETRRARIEQGIERLLRPRGLVLRKDEELMDIVVALNEYPTPILGRFDPAYLALPEEVLVTVMRHHQKYFSVSMKSGKLAPYFVAVINLDRDPGPIRSGHERVLAARFNDARFFWDADQKNPLGNRLGMLAAVLYESRLGSYGDKVQRMKQIAGWLADRLAEKGNTVDKRLALRAAELSKCDLTTELVREFTELEGIVGGLYARAQGEPEEVAQAIYDHYRPRGLEDSAPSTILGAIVSIADKIDSIASCFSVGSIPSGSSDPFALRRAGLGIVKVVLEHRLPLLLDDLAAEAVAVTLRGVKTDRDAARIQAEVLEFLEERARFFFRSVDGVAYDEANAVFSTGWMDLVDARERLRALKVIRPTENFEPLVVAFKRIRNIVEQAGPREKWFRAELDQSLLEEGAERALADRAREIARRVATLKQGHRYREALEQIASLRPAVDRFFDKVLVMVEDASLRSNRLSFLAWLAKEFSNIADFSEIVVTQEQRK